MKEILRKMFKNFAVILSAVLTLACSGSNSNADELSGPGTQSGTAGAAGKAGASQQACVPGAQVACACSGGVQGVQTCVPSGTGLDACSCGAAGSAGSGLGGSGGDSAGSGGTNEGGSSGAGLGGAGGNSGTAGVAGSGAGAAGAAAGAGGSGAGGSVCVPKSKNEVCFKSGLDCGVTTDGCGNPVDCGVCQLPLSCGAISANKCGCKPKTAAEACGTAFKCGEVYDGCTGMVSCGGCGAPYHCSQYTTKSFCETNCVYVTKGTAFCGGDPIWQCGGVPPGCGQLQNGQVCCPNGPMTPLDGVVVPKYGLVVQHRKASFVISTWVVCLSYGPVSCNG